MKRLGKKRIVYGIVFMLFGVLMLIAVTDVTVAGYLITGIFIIGVFGFGQIVLGVFFIIIHSKSENKLEELKKYGVLVLADAIELTKVDEERLPPHIKFYLRNFLHIRAIYKDFMGNEYIFKSAPLWMYPIPYLSERKVKVYHKRDNIKDYIIDIDGSIISGARFPSEHLRREVN
jgi:hypothetical protein